MARLWISANLAKPDPVVRAFHTAKQALIANIAAQIGFRISEERPGYYIDMYCQGSTMEIAERYKLHQLVPSYKCQGSTMEIAELLKAIYFETHLTGFVVDLEEGENPAPLRELRKLNENLVELVEEVEEI